jgi:hypothetical protein
VTPSGIEAGPNGTGSRWVTCSSTAIAALQRPAVTFDCNDCNEVLNAVRAALTVARRLALVAENALVNGDLRGAQGIDGEGQ